MHICMHACLCPWFVCACMRACTCAYVHTRTHSHAHAYTRTRTQTSTRAHTHFSASTRNLYSLENIECLCCIFVLKKSDLGQEFLFTPVYYIPQSIVKDYHEETLFTSSCNTLAGNSHHSQIFLDIVIITRFTTQYALNIFILLAQQIVLQVFRELLTVTTAGRLHVSNVFY